MIVCLKGSATISIHEERLQIFDNLKSFLSRQRASVDKLHNLEKKKVLNFYLLYKLRKFGDINQAGNSLATKKL